MEQNQTPATKPEGRGGKKALRRILAALAALLLALALAVFLIPITEKMPEEDRTGPSSTEWMAGLPDAIRLNQIILPGSHASAARCVPLAFFNRCQVLSVLEQLKAGVRLLDVPLRREGDRLVPVCGDAVCKKGDLPWSGDLDLQDLLDVCYAFVEAHPTETVIFCVSEAPGSGTTAEFAACLDTYVARRPNLWVVPDGFSRLRKCRGKLVLARRYADESLPEASGIPIPWPEQSSDDPEAHVEEVENEFFSLWVQDRSGLSADDKWQAFVKGLETAAHDSKGLAIHFLSTDGGSPLSAPRFCAKELNGRLLERDTGTLSGWILLDYVSAPLAEHIWQANEFPEAD